MKPNIIASVLFILIVFITFSSSLRGQAIADLEKEKAALEKELALLNQINDLKAKITVAKAGTAAPKTSPSQTPAVSDTSEKKIDEKINGLSSIDGLPNVFLSSDNKVLSSVCIQQGLDRDKYSLYEREICSFAEHLVIEARSNNAKTIRLRPESQLRQSVTYFIIGEIAKRQPTGPEIDKELRAFVLDAENKRTDKQVGSDSKSGGSTSLAMKGGVPRFLGWAVEHGAATGSRSGNTLTFRLNPAGLLDNLSAYQPIQGFDVNSMFTPKEAFTNALNKVSVGLSFDITRGTDPPTFIGSKQQLSAFSVRYNFLNKKDPLHSSYRNDWETLRTANLAPYSLVVRANYEKLVCDFAVTGCNPNVFVNADLEKWRNDTEQKLKAVGLEGKSNAELTESVRKIIAEQLSVMPVDKLKADPVILKAITAEGKAMIDYTAAKKKIQDKVAKGEVLTFEYTNYREVNSPDVSNLRFIAEKGFGSNWTLTANASLSFLNKKPVAINVKKIRDFDFTLQLEKPCGDLPFGKPICSFAGQWQRLPGNIVGPDGLIKMNTKGDTAVGQFKVTIPINGTGIKLPFSITFANRSELIREATVHGNFGFTFDLDRLLLGRKLF